MSLKRVLNKDAEIDYQTTLIALSNEILKPPFRIEDIGDYIPGIVMIQDLTAMTNNYINSYGCDYFNSNLQELKSMGSNYFEHFFPPDEIAALKIEWLEFLKLGDYTKVKSFFQRIRPNLKSDYSWFFTTTRLYDANGPCLMHVAVDVDTVSYAGRRISKLFDDTTYIRDNYHRYNLLSKREKEIIKLIVQDKSSYEIADMLYISIHTVNNHRKNIIGKLNTTSFSQLIKFAVAFDLL